MFDPDRLFTWLEQRGYRFAAADEVLADPALSEPHRYVGTFGPGLWDRLGEQKGTAKALEEVRKLIETQVAAWNRGDLDAFTAAYADDAAFLSPTGLTRGRNEVLARYENQVDLDPVRDECGPGPFMSPKRVGLRLAGRGQASLTRSCSVGRSRVRAGVA